MDLINPSPQVFERKDTDRKAVSDMLNRSLSTHNLAVCQLPLAYCTLSFCREASRSLPRMPETLLMLWRSLR